MKKIAFFVTTVVFCESVLGMMTERDEREVCFQIVSDGIKGNIVAKVPETGELRLMGSSVETVTRVEITDQQMDDIATSGSGTVEVYSSNDESKKLLEFNVEKLNGYTPAKVSLQNPDATVEAILYRPSMGGGDNFVLAIGHVGSDLSVARMQKVLPFGSVQMFFPVCRVGRQD